MNFSFYCEIYKVQIYIYFGDIDDKLHTFLRHLKSKGYDREWHERICKSSLGVVAKYERNLSLWMPRPPKTAREHATLVHEITHLVMYISDMCGIKYTEDNDEPFAYLAGWVARKIFDKILKEKTTAV